MALKIKTIEEMIEISQELKSNGKILVTTSGSFDILHYAHVHFLERAKEKGDRLVILLNSDLSVKRAKGEKRPIIPQDERALMLASLECVDYIVIFNEDKPLQYLTEIRGDLHVKGGSFILERIREEKELVESWGGKYKTFSLEKGYSTTKVIERILEVYK